VIIDYIRIIFYQPEFSSLFPFEIQRDFGSDFDFFGETHIKTAMGEPKKLER
jgi:hypothetical protein